MAGAKVCVLCCTHVLCNTFKYAQKSAINSSVFVAAAEHVLYSGRGAAFTSICQHCVTGPQDRGSGDTNRLLLSSRVSSEVCIYDRRYQNRLFLNFELYQEHTWSRMSLHLQTILGIYLSIVYLGQCMLKHIWDSCM